MKSVVISIILLLIIFSVIYYSTNYINVTATELSLRMEKIIDYTQDENWEEVGKLNKEIIEKWLIVSKVYNCFIHHEEVDKISIYMEEIDKYITSQEKTNTLAAAGSLRFLFEHLPKKDALTVENVL